MIKSKILTYLAFRKIYIKNKNEKLFLTRSAVPAGRPIELILVSTVLRAILCPLWILLQWHCTWRFSVSFLFTAMSPPGYSTISIALSGVKGCGYESIESFHP